MSLSQVVLTQCHDTTCLNIHSGQGRFLVHVSHNCPVMVESDGLGSQTKFVKGYAESFFVGSDQQSDQSVYMLSI